jgi:hypothetical protein
MRRSSSPDAVVRSNKACASGAACFAICTGLPLFADVFLTLDEPVGVRGLHKIFQMPVDLQAMSVYLKDQGDRSVRHLNSS